MTLFGILTSILRLQLSSFAPLHHTPFLFDFCESHTALVYPRQSASFDRGVPLAAEQSERAKFVTQVVWISGAIPSCKEDGLWQFVSTTARGIKDILLGRKELCPSSILASNDLKNCSFSFLLLSCRHMLLTSFAACAKQYINKVQRPLPGARIPFLKSNTVLSTVAPASAFPLISPNPTSFTVIHYGCNT